MQTSPILVINGTEELLQIVIGTRRGVLFHCGINAPGRTMKFLVPTIHTGLKSLSLALKDLAGIACTRGPGSFTGIRIVLATLEGLTRGCALPVCGLDYLSILVRDISCPFAAEAWILTYARKTQVYIQGFTMPGGLPLAHPRACTLDQAVATLCARKMPIMVHGSGLKKNREFFQDQLPDTAHLLQQGCDPSPAGLLRAGLEGTFSSDPLVPLYLRHSDAEDNLAAIARTRGISLEDALQHIPLFETPLP